MAGFIDFLRNLLQKLGIGSSGKARETAVSENYDEALKVGIISQEPLLAFKDGYLVIIVDHTFDDVPSWVEWDQERQTISITQMDGHTDEAKVNIKAEHVQTLEQARKLLLVSNDNEEKIVHYVPFLTRK